MNLENFESCVDAKILQRGLEYYNSGQVEALEYDGAVWTAEVSGSDEYHVRVTLSDPEGADTGDSDTNIIESDCDCPYDFGAICKHQVAVFYALKNWPLQKLKNEARKTRESLDEIVSGLDKATLAAFVVDYASRNNRSSRRFRDDLLVRFSKTPDVTEYARKLIKETIKEVMYRGFVDYADVSYAVEGAYAVLDMVKKQPDVFAAVNLCFVILEEMVKLEANCDDSNGEVGGVIECAFMALSDSTAALPPDFSEHEKLMDLLLHHGARRMYDGWPEWRMSVYRAAVPLCAESAARKKLEKRLTSFQKPKTDVDRTDFDRYDERESQNIQYQIILTFDGEALADEYIERHLRNVDFRKMAINNPAASSGVCCFSRGIALRCAYPYSAAERRGMHPFGSNRKSDF
ncbi:MAG: hypothetical protein Ta2A_01410 [Treponemataceae bacterium]|nr:MAG: hypothetical protein Ta2A_01410 [Treponemataceae bacterium]